MLLRHLIISLLVVVSPVFPPAIIPITYTLIGIRLLQWANPITMSVATVIPATMSSVLIRLLYGYINKRISAFKKNRNNDDRISHLQRRFTSYIENTKRLNRINTKIKQYLTTQNSKIMLFLMTILGIDSAIPDFVIIGIVRKKLPFPLFILAAFIGKAIVYLPIILAGKGILYLIGIK